MSHSKMLATASPPKSIRFGLQPALAWTAILGFVFICALCILAGAGSIARLIFPMGSLVVGAFLYWRYPILYLGFIWWLWFLTPWVRRLIDYRSGWAEPSTVLLAPYLATFVTLATLLLHLPKCYKQGSFPFVLSFVGVVYAVIVGLVNSRFGDNSYVVNKIINSSNFTYTPMSVLVNSIQWITPIILGMHLFVNWKYYPEYRQNMQRIFFWGVLIMGGYGVLQYLVAPEWDKFWLTNVINLLGGYTFGTPEPLKIRVFSTMHAPQIFAVFMMAGLLLLLTSKGTLRFFAMAVGYLAFLLSLIRSAWGGWFLGLLIFMSSLKAHLQMRLIVTILVVLVCAFPLTTVEPFSDVINTRLQTLTNVQEDGSFQARSQTYDRALGFALLQPVGNGLGLPGVDSAIIDIFIGMGWLGVIPYFGGIALLLIKLLSGIHEGRIDPFASASFAISISLFTQIIFANVLTGPMGIIFWSFVGITLAAHKYHQYQRVAGLDRG